MAKGQKGKRAKGQKGKKGKSTNRMPKSFWAQFKMEAGTASSTKNTSTMTPSTSKSLAEKLSKKMSTQNKDKINCPLCNKTLSALSLVTHMAIVHGQGAAHECAECKQRFATKERFTKHMNKHRLQMTKDITCEKCNYKTSKSVYLNNHIRTMHLMAEEVYRCMEKGCMKVFITRYQFKRHQELHKNVSCELCNKLFTAARSLKRHKNKQHLLIAESQDDTDNPLVAAHDIAFIIA